MQKDAYLYNERCFFMEECLNCGNRESKYFAIKNNKYYCRRCLSFKCEHPIPVRELNNHVYFQINYDLSLMQKEISIKVVKAFINKQNVLIKAVCGSGKTELVYGVIEYALKNNLQVGFTVPRKDVIIDLLPRIKNAFPLNKVIGLYGGHTEEKQGDIILLTTHQLYRYVNYFDLLIIDETDAFPYYGNSLLNKMFDKALKGNYIMLSATPLEEMIEKIKNENGVIFELNKRYHGKNIPEPKLIKSLLFKEIITIYFLFKFVNDNKPTMVFTPTIDCCEKLYRLISFLKKNGNYVHSKKENRDQIIEKFKQGELKYLICTSVLERGVTIKNVQVIVYKASHNLYDQKTLIQIAGRVGRKIDAYDGEVIFVGEYISSSMRGALNEIRKANTS